MITSCMIHVVILNTLPFKNIDRASIFILANEGRRGRAFCAPRQSTSVSLKLRFCRTRVRYSNKALKVYYGLRKGLALNTPAKSTKFVLRPLAIKRHKPNPCRSHTERRGSSRKGRSPDRNSLFQRSSIGPLRLLPGHVADRKINDRRRKSQMK